LLILTNNPQRGSFKDRIGRYLDIFRAAGIEPTVAVLSSNPLKRWGQYRQADTYDVVLLHKKCLNFLDARFFRPRKAKVIFNYDDAVMFNDKGCPTPATSAIRRSSAPPPARKRPYPMKTAKTQRHRICLLWQSWICPR